MIRSLSILVFLCGVSNSSFSQVLSYRQDIIKFRSDHWKSLIADPRTTLLVKDSSYLDYYKVKESNKVYCTVELITNPVEIEMPTYSGKIKSFRKYALLHFTWKGKLLKLTAYQSLQQLSMPLYKEYLFIPFKDKTTNKSTYGGGRYIDIKPGQAPVDHLILDLNQVYNPWCAYSDGYNCPIPPTENALPVALKVGEKKFKKSH
ncbi:MAG: DUF1684 domain-containing protein [Saprospiraceae bacterium]